jgi:hypothetical protein
VRAIPQAHVFVVVVFVKVPGGQESGNNQRETARANDAGQFVATNVYFTVS